MEDEQLIEAVKNRPLLYATNLLAYRNRTKKGLFGGLFRKTLDVRVRSILTYLDSLL